MSQTIPAIHIGLMSLKEGQIVGERYQLDRLIAQGGFGAVWRAKDLESGREVAVKFPRPDLASGSFGNKFVLKAFDPRGGRRSTVPGDGAAAELAACVA